MFGGGYKGDVEPSEAYRAMQSDKEAQLVDVRTLPEWQFVGTPDLTDLGREAHLIAWQVYPSMGLNSGFVNAVKEVVSDPETPIFFLCRSGARSAAAAAAMTAAGYQNCFNIAGGFQGDVGADGHRGKQNGWQAAGLPWHQG
ncbi:MAG: rhodanese-like domain-containing protein [Pseudomonadota bacterium]